eukprot:scaffold26794_cov129-Isochrysis_galbana.AAC.2
MISATSLINNNAPSCSLPSGSDTDAHSPLGRDLVASTGLVETSDLSYPLLAAGMSQSAEELVLGTPVAKEQESALHGPPGPRDSVRFTSMYSAPGAESALDTRRQMLKDNQRTILVFEVDAKGHSSIRHMSRRELLEEARSKSTPLRLRAAPGQPQPKLTGNDALLKARDIRKVDPLFAGRLEPIIFVRCGSITVSLGRTELRAIITHDRLYFIVPDGADSLLHEVNRNLTQVLKGGDHGSAGPPGAQPFSNATGPYAPHTEGGTTETPAPAGAPPLRAGVLGSHHCGPPPPMQLPPDATFQSQESHAPPTFEFAALEAVLMIACSDLHKRQESLQLQVKEALHELSKTVLGSRVVAGSRQLETVRELKQAVRELTLTAQALDRAIGACLEEDDDMARMYLTRLHHAEARRRDDGMGEVPTSPKLSFAMPGEDQDDHEEVEMLLESYAQEVGSTLGALDAVTYSIESTEKFVSFRLDSARNRLLKVDVLAGILAAIFGAAAFVVGVFGMNFKTPLFDDEEDRFGLTEGTLFNIVIFSLLFLLLTACAGTYFFFTTTTCCTFNSLRRNGKLRRTDYL